MIEALGPAAAWAIGWAVIRVMHHVEFRRAPEKAARYRQLPLRHKLQCGLLVVPCFTALPLFLYGRGHEVASWAAMAVLAPAAAMWVEVNAVSWYRRKGLL